MRRWLGLLAGLWILVLGACSSGTDAASSQTTAKPAEAFGPQAANDAVPSGVDLKFETVEINLHEGEYPASVVAPVGWTQDDFMGISFEPPEDAGSDQPATFEVKSGCQGMCEPTDWEERLNGPDGILPQPDDGTEVLERRETPGSAGVVLITDEEPETKILVVRWDDSADRYFECESRVGSDELVAAFEAACLAARPDWFPVG